jgi:protein gp37
MATGIGWATDTWNPILGCTLVGPECENCYAMKNIYRRGKRFPENQPYLKGLTRENRAGRPVWTNEILVRDEKIHDPLGMSGQKVIFVPSLSDLGHPDVPVEKFLAIFGSMFMATRHIFLVLTKRPETFVKRFKKYRIKLPDHIWLGVSVGIAVSKERIDVLRQIECAIRFLSLEPLIGPLGRLELSDIGWAIVGGESISKKDRVRPCREKWMIDIRDQVVDAGVPLFVKQWGDWAYNPLAVQYGVEEAKRMEREVAERMRLPYPEEFGGCVLDGRLWREIPEGIYPQMLRAKKCVDLVKYRGGAGEIDRWLAQGLITMKEARARKGWIARQRVRDLV